MESVSGFSQTPPAVNDRSVGPSPCGFPPDRAAGTVERVARKRKKRWSDLSPVARTAIVVGTVAELVVTAVALRDLVCRPSAEVRGRKSLWGLGLFVQPVGSPLYLLVGRSSAR